MTIGLGFRCKCATSLMTVKVAFQRRCSKPGKLVKRFSETGLEQIYTVIFWLWRELIVSAIANGSSTEAINEYLVDIEHERTWKSLQRVLNGGTARKNTPCAHYRQHSSYTLNQQLMSARMTSRMSKMMTVQCG